MSCRHSWCSTACPGIRMAPGCTPLLYASIGALALTALLWPAAALVRRRYRARLALDSVSLRAYRLSRIAAILILGGLGLWAFVLARMLNDLNYLGDQVRLAHRARAGTRHHRVHRRIGRDAVESGEGVDRQSAMAGEALERGARAGRRGRAVGGSRVPPDRLWVELLMSSSHTAHRRREAAPRRALSHLGVRLRGTGCRRRDARRRRASRPRRSVRCLLLQRHGSIHGVGARGEARRDRSRHRPRRCATAVAAGRRPQCARLRAVGARCATLRYAGVGTRRRSGPTAPGHDLHPGRGLTGGDGGWARATTPRRDP